MPCGFVVEAAGVALATRPRDVSVAACDRRTLLAGLSGVAAVLVTPQWPHAHAAVRISDETVQEDVVTPSGLTYYDFRRGEGAVAEPGRSVQINYTCGTTGARYGWKIDSTYERDEPFRFVSGDSTVIAGLNEAVSTMREGGRRRAIIPAKLGYRSWKDKPIPPGFENRQRFKNIFLNSNRPYVPDIVFDIELIRVR